jgi:F420-0:gamma-glutamyl ligase-like protein
VVYGRLVDERLFECSILTLLLFQASFEFIMYRISGRVLHSVCSRKHVGIRSLLEETEMRCLCGINRF